MKNLKVLPIIVTGICLSLATANASEQPTWPKTLGWLAQPKSDSLCQGHFKPIKLPSRHASKNIQMKAKHSKMHFNTGEIELMGNVSVSRRLESLRANRAKLRRDPKTGKITQIKLYGDVQWRQPNTILTSNFASVTPLKHQGYVTDARYRVALSALASTGLIMTPTAQLQAHGQAKRAEQIKQGKFVFQQTNYTTCSPTNPTWKLHASKIKLNQETGTGQATNVFLTVKHVPVFYSPFLTFPIDNRRHSGFLPPTFSENSRVGTAIALPYYFNLAPNYDMTLTTNWLSKRGWLFNDTFRYLTPNSRGRLHLGYIPYDREFSRFKDEQRGIAGIHPLRARLLNAPDYRGHVHWWHQDQLSKNLSAFIDYSHVSDDYYLQDFTHDLFTSSENQLRQVAELTWHQPYWQLQTLAEHYQTLHPINQAAVNNQYSRLPGVRFYANDPSGTFFFRSTYNRFIIERDPTTKLRAPYGDRIIAVPQLQHTLDGRSGFITANVQLHGAYYRINNQGPTRKRIIQHAIPQFGLDTGLYFDRRFNWHNQSYYQTLEPRLFYLYVPYQGQHDIPLFDTEQLIFNYDQLFRYNRFSGDDRIGDANQISFALTTRLFTGNDRIEKADAYIGQIIYLQDRRVTLCNVQGCSDDATAVGAISNTEKLSPIVAGLNYHINPVWSLRTNVAWAPDESQRNNQQLNLHYQPNANKILDLGYSFIRNGDQLTNPTTGTLLANRNRNLNQISLAAAWPLTKHINGFAKWRYNISHHYPQTYFGGVEYDSCCVAIRALAGQKFSRLSAQLKPKYDTLVYLQFQFKGLGNVGPNDPGKLLKVEIPGYQDQIFDSAS